MRVVHVGTGNRCGPWRRQRARNMLTSVLLLLFTLLFQREREILGEGDIGNTSTAKALFDVLGRDVFCGQILA